MNNLSLKNGEPNENGIATESENQYITVCLTLSLHMKKRFMKLLNRMFLKHRTSKMLQYTLEATLLYHC